jgi:DNA-binding NarL/FixJ family response regulator
MISVTVLAARAAVRAGLVSLLSDQADFRVRSAAAGASEVGAARDGAAGAGPGFPPGPPADVLVIAERPGPEVLEALSAGAPPTVLVSDDALQIARLIGSGVPAWAVVAPDVGSDGLGAAVRAVHQGLLAGSPELLSPLVTAQRLPSPEQLQERLSPREAEVLELLAQGLGNKQIAWELGLSEHTIKFHTSSIYSKLGVTNRTEAVRRGIEHGLLHL